MIEVRGLRKQYGHVVAVEDVSFSVGAGELVGLIGHNGAGKSTTIKMLTGLIRPTSGTGLILGHDIWSDMLPIKRRIGVVTEGLSLFEHLTAREYLMFVGRIHRLDRQVITDRSAELIGMMELEEHAGKLVIQYSAGMRKKLAVSAALIHDPDIYFLDEPFEGIDAIVSRQIRDVLQAVVAKGATVFLTSHILEIVERLCTHVGIIDRGCLVAQGAVDDWQHAGSQRTIEEIFLSVVGADESRADQLSWLQGGDPTDD